MNKDLLHSKVELFETGGEISYQGDANVAKFLLGGIGTGNIAVGARGQLLDWEIFNWPGKDSLYHSLSLQFVQRKREKNL